MIAVDDWILEVLKTSDEHDAQYEAHRARILRGFVNQIDTAGIACLQLALGVHAGCRHRANSFLLTIQKD